MYLCTMPGKIFAQVIIRQHCLIYPLSFLLFVVQNLVEQMPPHQIKFEREAIELSLVKTFFSVTNWRINMCAA